MVMGRLSDLPRHLIAAGAVMLSCWFLIRSGADATLAAASIYFILACTIDALHSRIPNLVNVGLCLAGLILNTGHAGWSGLLNSVSGLILGIALLLLPWLMGGFGAGDVKALGALGSLIGPGPLLHVFIYMALFGGFMAVLHYIFERDLRVKAREWWISVQASILSKDPRLLKPSKSEPLRFPYAAAIAYGYYTYLIFGKVL